MIRVRVPSRTSSLGYSVLEYENAKNYHTDHGSLYLSSGTYQVAIFAAGQWMSVECGDGISKPVVGKPTW